MTGVEARLVALTSHLKGLGSLAVAYSGGVDSTFLLSTAMDALDGNVIAVTVLHLAFSEREAAAARAYCASHGIRQIETKLDELSIPGFSANPPDRCYLCKKEIFARIREAAAQAGCTYVAEGSNLDDERDYRPGLRALRELDILSPLKDAGLSKADIRELSAIRGLSTARAPSMACLATRIPYGEEITREKLGRIAAAEDFLAERGFGTVRVRSHGDIARIEVPPEDFGALIAMARETERYMREIGFEFVTMDLGGFCSGSMNRALDREIYGQDTLSGH